MNHNKIKRSTLGLVCLAIVLTAALAGGKSSSTTLGPAKGTLIIVGGGKLGPEIVGRFIELAGGPESNFVVIPTAISDQVNVDQENKRFSTVFGVKNFVVLHTRDRNQANSKEFVEPLRHATGVWI